MKYEGDLKRALLALGVIVSALLSLAFLAQEPPAQSWIPIIATRSKSTYELSASGKKMINQVTEVYMRDSHGSEYMRDTPVIGLPAAITNDATLKDMVSGKMYDLNYSTKTATVVQDPLQQPSPQVFTASLEKHGQPLGKKTIAGVECQGWSVPGRSGGTMEIWLAPSLDDLLVEMRVTEGGWLRETTTDKIEVGQEPDPRYFQVPAGFMVH